jgi:hypothetical protein
MSVGFKSTYAALKTVLQIPVINHDGANAIANVALFNDQPNREKEGTGYSYSKPAIFVEPIFSEGKPIGNKATSYELTFKLLIQIEHFNTEGSFDEPLVQFDLKDTLHRVLNGLKLPNCSPLFASGKAIDTNHGNQYLLTVDYSTHFIDLISTVYDDQNGILFEETLIEPSLHNVYTFTHAETPSAPCVQAHEITIFDCITCVTCTPLADYNLSLQLVSAIYIDPSGYVINYFVDWGDGDVEAITVGQSITHKYDPALTYHIVVGSNRGSEVGLTVNTNTSGGFEEYMPVFIQNFTYDLWCKYNPNYPLKITNYMAITGGGGIDNYIIQEQSGNVLFEDASPIFPITTNLSFGSSLNNAFYTFYHTEANDQSLQAVTILNLRPI